MLHWLKKWLQRKEKRETPEERIQRIRALMPDAIGILGEMMETGPTFVFPASKLPMPKEEMKIALKLAWASMKNEKMRNHLALAYASLSQFQEGVNAPFEMPSFRSDLYPLKRAHFYFQAVETRAMEEMKALAEEFSEFQYSSSKLDHASALTAEVARQTGKIRINPNARAEITLTESSDFSTLMYLQGTEFLKQLARDARHPKAPRSLHDDLQIILEWLRVPTADQIAVEHYDRFARGWQLYMWEGVAPTPRLSETFSNSSKFMREIHPNRESLNIELTLEVRGVFARMLCS